jgi:hypothetical protein
MYNCICILCSHVRDADLCNAQDETVLQISSKFQQSVKSTEVAEITPDGRVLFRVKHDTSFFLRVRRKIQHVLHLRRIENDLPLANHQLLEVDVDELDSFA